MFTITPLVSVCIPAFNCEKYIGETIHCLLNQTYKNLEIIVVDDGSTDGTEGVLKSVGDKRFRYITQSNKGASSARNAAFKWSAGDFIKFMDADDLLNPECIEKQLQKIAGKPGAIASAKWGRFYNDDVSDFRLSAEKVWQDLPGIDWLINSLIDTGANMMQPGIFLVPRNIIESAGPWNEELSLIDDFEYMVRVIANSNQVLFCEEAVLMYRSGVANNLSGKSSAKHMQSAFQSLQLGVEKILAVRNDSLSRKACANTYKRWSSLFYPAYMEMYNKMEMEIEKLGGSDIPVFGSRSFNTLSKLVGWKAAKKLKILINGNRR